MSPFGASAADVGDAFRNSVTTPAPEISRKVRRMISFFTMHLPDQIYEAVAPLGPAPWREGCIRKPLGLYSYAWLVFIVVIGFFAQNLQALSQIRRCLLMTGLSVEIVLLLGIGLHIVDVRILEDRGSSGCTCTDQYERLGTDEHSQTPDTGSTHTASPYASPPAFLRPRASWIFSAFPQVPGALR